MDTIVQTTATYFILLVSLALFGKRSLAEVTIFNFVVLLVIAEVGGEGLLGEQSVTSVALSIVTLLTLSWLMDLLAFRSKRLDKVLNDSPTVIVEHGRILEDRARDFTIEKEDILRQARASQGLERMDQIKYAILERDGQISIIPR